MNETIRRHLLEERVEAQWEALYGKAKWEAAEWEFLAEETQRQLENMGG